jgi:hypothetical protein
MAESNVYDQAGRFTAKLDPLGILCWVLNLRPDALIFRRWLDTRLIPFPGAPDRTCDTVASIEDVQRGQVPWALLLEFQIAPDPLMFGRVTVYLGQVWLEEKPSPERGDRFCIAARIVNLTGRGNAERTMDWPEAGLSTHMGIRDSNLCDIDAKATLDGIVAGKIAPVILPFIPLMQGGGDSSNIQQWLTLASAEPDARRRGHYGALALLFAEPAGNLAVWTQALTGWNMIQSQVVTGWMNQGKLEGKAEAILRLLKLRFQSVPAEVENGIRAATDLTTLERWFDLAYSAADLAAFRRDSGL